MGHVNNAAYWAAVEQRLVDHGFDLGMSLRARLDYRHPIDLDDRVELTEESRDGRYCLAFVVEDAVKAVARVDPV
jgi:acyl-ACP thioesterase